MTRAAIAVLAGGLATRMQPLTRSTPKFLLPVAGRPFAVWLLERVAASGFASAVVCIGHLGDEVRAALGARAGGVDLLYSDEGDARLGTGGALALALPLLREAFLVTYGDSYLTFDYAAPLRDLAAHPGADGTMAVYENRGALEASNAAVSGELVARYEKDAQDGELEFVDYGALALREAAVRAMGSGAWSLAALQASLARRGALRAHVVSERFYEIGSPRGLAELEAKLAPRR